MADLQKFAVTRNGTVNVPNCPQWKIEFQITDSKTGAVLRDFTGANALSFPQVLAQFSQADQDELIAEWVVGLIRKKAPDVF